MCLAVGLTIFIRQFFIQLQTFHALSALSHTPVLSLMQKVWIPIFKATVVQMPSIAVARLALHHLQAYSSASRTIENGLIILSNTESTAVFFARSAVYSSIFPYNA